MEEAYDSHKESFDAVDTVYQKGMKTNAQEKERQRVL